MRVIWESTTNRSRITRERAQDVQKGLSARPQQAKDRVHPLRFVEGLRDAKTIRGKCASLGKEVVLAASGQAGEVDAVGWAGEKSDFFSVLLGDLVENG